MTHASEPPRGLPVRSQVDFAIARRATLFKHAALMPPSLSRAIPLEPAHDPGRLGLLLAEMRAMVCRGFYDSLALWSAGAVRVLVACVVPLRLDGCSWHVRCTSSPALWSQLMVLGGSDAFVRRCVRWCMLCFVARSYSGTRASDVRVCCLRSHVALKLRGTDPGRILVQCGPMMHEVILGVLDTPDRCYKRW